MENITISFLDNHSGKFREAIEKTANQICSQYIISNTSLAKNVLGFGNECTLRSLKKTERKDGIEIDSVRACYILFLLDKKSGEEYFKFFKSPEQVKQIVEDINIEDYEKKLLKVSHFKNNSSTNLTENTQLVDTLSNTPDESILQTTDNQNTEKESVTTAQGPVHFEESPSTGSMEDAQLTDTISNTPDESILQTTDNQNTEKESVTTTQEPPIINNFKNYLKSVLGDEYELTIEQIKYGQYFILKCTNKKNNKFKTIVVIALKQILDTFEPDLPEINNYEIYEEEIEIIKETLNNADYFWFFHHKETSQEEFDNYIADVPELSSKTLIETITIDNNTYILHCNDTSKFIKKLKQDDCVEEGDLQLNGSLLFEFPTSEQ